MIFFLLSVDHLKSNVRVFEYHDIMHQYTKCCLVHIKDPKENRKQISKLEDYYVSNFLFDHSNAMRRTLINSKNNDDDTISVFTDFVLFNRMSFFLFFFIRLTIRALALEIYVENSLSILLAVRDWKRMEICRNEK